MHTLLIASYLEPKHIERIKAVSPDVDVCYEPALIPPARFPADHVGSPFQRGPQQESAWRELLGKATILFDFDRTHLSDLPELAPRLKWIQTTSSGVGQLVQRENYAARMPDVVITTARGVHAQPLAEFCLMVMISFVKNFGRMQKQQQGREWQRFSGSDLSGRTITVVGLGKIGVEVARLAQALRMRVIGVKRVVDGTNPASVHVNSLMETQDLDQILPETDVLVVSTPHTPDTEHLIDRNRIGRLKQGAIVINVGRGPVIDERAMIEALQTGHLRGAGLDVFETEPLPTDNPLWSMPNVIVSPHSAGTSDRENARITDIFCDNLERFLSGNTMNNVFDISRSY